ncbi:hypothetical protein ACEPAI_4362 [Sanghuangporus weigelae]
MVDRTGYADFQYQGETFQTWFRVVGNLDSGARPLVILHGGPAIPNPYLDPHADLYISRNIPVVFYDQIGCGQSTHLREKPAEFFTINLFMDQLDDLLHKLGVTDDFDLYGHSWGGMLVSDYVASRQPKGLKRLIIANAPASIPLFVKCVEKLFDKMSPGLAERIRRHEIEGTTDDSEYKEATQRFFMKHICSVEPIPDTVSAAFKALREDKTVYNALWGPYEIEFSGSLATWSVIDKLHSIKVPTLVLNGQDDEMQDECVAPFLWGISKVKWIKLENSGHMPFYEEKERYFQVIGEFLRP